MSKSKTFYLLLSLGLFQSLIQIIYGFQGCRNDRILKSISLQSSTHSDLITEIKKIDGIQEGLKFRRLPNSDLHVSEICLGTMNFGDQLNPEQSIAILNTAFGEYGINFLDTAELYPAPNAASTAGSTEKIIGQWLKTKKRSDVILSTKICGFSDQITWLGRSKDRTIGTRANREQIIAAVDAQLERLGTDYIDLLQINWPERYVPLYGAPDYRYELERKEVTSIKEQLETMNELMKSGKIRYFGVSNETPYGIGLWTAYADLFGLSKPITTQNQYNLLCRNDFENGMMEACSPTHGNIGLLAYSPLAGGSLTGKYLDSSRLQLSSRLHKYVGFMHRYLAPPATQAIKEYISVAESFSLPLAPIALAFVYSRKFVSSTIIGVSSLSQLRDNVLALNIPIDKQLFEAIHNVYRRHIDPTKGVFEVIDPTIEYLDPSKLPWGAKDQDVDPELDLLINQRMSKF